MSTMILSPVNMSSPMRLSRTTSFVRTRPFHTTSSSSYLYRQKSQLDHDIARLHTLLEQLVRSRDEHKDALAAAQPLTSALFRIPPEIFQEIFSYCLPSGQAQMGDFTDGPMKLAHVCSSWRSIVFGTSRMWSTLEITIPRRQDAELIKARLAAMEDWLKRSNQQPLAVSLRAPSGSANATPFIESLLGHSQRWRDISLDLPSHYLSALQSLDSSSVPLLQSFSVADSFHNTEGAYSRGAFNNQLWSDNLTFLRDSNVTSVSLSRQRGLLHLPALPLSTLQSLSISADDHLFLDLDAYIYLLSQSPNLHAFSLNIADWEYAPAVPTASEPVSLPSLRNFSLGVKAYPSAPLSIAGFLERLSLPNAQKVKLSNGGLSNARVDAESIRAVEELVQRSASKSLEKVILKGLAGDAHIEGVKVERV